MRQPAFNSPYAINAPAAQAGFTLIELMIAIALSLIVVGALAMMFVSSSRSRDELEAANQQIENGRYALVTVTDDLQLAGFMSQFNIDAAVVSGLPLPAAKPDACATALATLQTSITMPIQGYNNNVNPLNHCGGASFPTLTDRKAATDVVVIRRVSTCTRLTADCGDADGDVAGAPYFQASTCSPVTGGAELSNPDPTEWLRLNTNIASLDRRRRGAGGACVNFAPMRQFLTHIYYVASNFQAGDGIPTLMRIDLGMQPDANADGFSDPIPIANGIENLQFEYGIDTGSDGSPDAFAVDPDLYNRAAPGTPFANCGANPDCIDNWRDVMAVRIFLLARNTTESPGYSDTKTYDMGSGSTVGPFGDRFKRHAYQTVVRLTNPAGRREQ